MTSWQTEGNQPTDNQVRYIKELCDHLNLDYEQIKPSTFDEASELIEELYDDAIVKNGWKEGWLGKW